MIGVLIFYQQFTKLTNVQVPSNQYLCVVKHVNLCLHRTRTPNSEVHSLCLELCINYMQTSA